MDGFSYEVLMVGDAFNTKDRSVERVDIFMLNQPNRLITAEVKKDSIARIDKCGFAID